QGEGGGGGMSSASGASVPGSAPNASPGPSGAQVEANKAADELIKNFSQGGFRDLRNQWGDITDVKKKLQLIDMATDLGLFWVGPDDETSLENCWQSFGDGFVAAVKLEPILWNRSIYRGVDPENIHQTKGLSERFKKDVLATAEANLNTNEDRVVKEFQTFGLEPPWQLVRPSQPDRNKLASGPAPSIGGPSPVDLLAEQARLARTVIKYELMLNVLRARKVGLALFNPLGRPPADKDVTIVEGLTMWDVGNDQWARISTEIALILNAWPVLYSAHATGSLQSFADQVYDKPDPSKPFDPKAKEQREAGLEAVRGRLTGVLAAIKKVRDDGMDPLDLVPVQRALYEGRATPASGQQAVREVMIGILDDERKTRDFEAAMLKLGVDAVIMAAMIAASVGTLGGAAVVIGAVAAAAPVGVAGVGAARADEKSDNLKAAYGASVSDATTLVTKEAVTAAAEEAEQAKVELAQAVIMSVLDLGMVAHGHVLELKDQQKARELLGQINARKGGPAVPGDDLRAKLRPPATGGGPGGIDTSPMKPWGLSPELRALALEGPVNTRLKGDGIPELRRIVPNPKVKNGARFVAKDWTMEIDPNFLKGDAISQNDFDHLVLDVYHEGRHGYQTFHMARWRQMKLAAGENLGEKFTFEIHPDVAKQVTPMKPGDPLESLAAKWHESMYGAKSLERNAIYKNMDNAELILDQKKAALRALPKATRWIDRKLAENQVELARLEFRKYDIQYRSLPEEIDAYAISGEQAKWARSALDARAKAQIDGAQAVLDSANVRVAESAEELALYEGRGVTGQGLDEARTRLQQARADARQAEERLAEIRVGR
ncbi:MAG TPA: hypothetical protein VF244_11155, partial [Acidimicrobiales bacterium]